MMNNQNMPRQMRPRSGMIFWVILGLCIVLYLVSVLNTKEYGTITGFYTKYSNGMVGDIIIKPNADNQTGSLIYYTSDNVRNEVYLLDVTETAHDLDDREIKYAVADIPRTNWVTTYFIPFVMIILIGAFYFIMIAGNRVPNQGDGGSGGGGRFNDFTKSRARKQDANKNPIKLTDVAGLTEEKEDLEEIIQFLKTPEKFTSVGARVPKGILLEGPPGTGKTLLARAIAGEAGVPFFSISGSDFVEMFVGVGAARVRSLFADAKANSPCIVFIDEIDAVGRRRGSGLGGGHDEREQTLNQLLVEMDGFEPNSGIIVLAATNRVDILDTAILRPGRFDRKVTIGPPDVRAREEILKVHARNKPLAEDVDLESIARTTAGFTGADLENLLNESAIRAAKNDRKYILMEDINKAFIHVGIGTERKSQVISEKDRKVTAYHEAGHAILFHLLPDVGPVYTVSIIPTGNGAAGYTMPLPAKDEMFMTRGKMLQDIMVSLGGRIAEEIIFDDITTGASSDIKKATSVARKMITRYGMSKNIGVVCYDDGEEVFVGRDYGHTKSISEKIAGEIDAEVKAIVDECYDKAKAMIQENIDVLHKCSELLLEKEKITRDEFEALFE